MFETTGELSSDLDTLLISGRADPALLVDALTREYYSSLYSLALSILDDNEAASYVTLETFVRAALDAPRFSNRGAQPDQSSLRAWLVGIALQVCRPVLRSLVLRRALRAALPLRGRASDFGSSIPNHPRDAFTWLAVDSLDEKLRLPLLLHTLHGWQTAEIASLLKTAENTVQTRLRSGRRKFYESFLHAGFSEKDLESDSLEGHISRSLQRRWPLEILPSAGMEAVRAEVIAQVARRKR